MKCLAIRPCGDLRRQRALRRARPRPIALRAGRPAEGTRTEGAVAAFGSLGAIFAGLGSFPLADA